MSQRGYIYVLYNPSANGIVKIGKTQRNPDERAKELSSATGVPTPFIVVYQSDFQDVDKAELFIHTRLDKYRVSNNREFFQLPINLAVDTVLEAKKLLEKSGIISDEPDDSDYSNGDNPVRADFLDSSTLENELDPAVEMFLAANDYYYGDEEAIQDYDEAFNLYQKAARLGFAEAFLQLGIMCRDGEGRIKDNRRAVEFFKEGIKHGYDECWGEMAELFHSEGHKDNEEKCWRNYFSSKDFDSFSERRCFTIYHYVEISVLENRPIIYKEQIIKHRREVLEWINKLIINSGPHDLLRLCSIAVKEL